MHHPGCQKLGAKFIPQENEFEFEEDSQVISNWHCQKRCSLADHCTTYNWNMAGRHVNICTIACNITIFYNYKTGENECVLINGVEGENKLMEAESWVAGVSDCSSLYAFTYQGDFSQYPHTTNLNIGLCLLKVVKVVGGQRGVGSVPGGQLVTPRAKALWLVRSFDRCQTPSSTC